MIELLICISVMALFSGFIVAMSDSEAPGTRYAGPVLMAISLALSTVLRGMAQ